MTKDNIKQVLISVINDFNNKWKGHDELFNGVDNYAKQIFESFNLRLSEQKEKHEKEMEEFAEWCEYECWYYVGQSIWTKRISGDIRKVIEKATTTELLTKFRVVK